MKRRPPRIRPTRRLRFIIPTFLVAALIGVVAASPLLHERSTSQTPTVARKTHVQTAKPKKPKPPAPKHQATMRLPAPARNAWHTYVVHLVLGRTDGTTAHPGALEVWVDGSNKPAIDVKNVNTLQRANGVTQKWMQLWEGDYTRALQKVQVQSFALTRIGRTLKQALRDRPTSIGSSAPGQYYTGSGVNDGPPTVTKMPSRFADQAQIPSSLGGNTARHVPLPTFQIKLTPNYVSPNDGTASNYQAVWVYPRSATTPWISPDSMHHQGRYLLVDPRATDSRGQHGQDEFWLVIERNWPTEFDPLNHGSWGTLLNFHNVAGDVGWDSGSGVSAVALNWERLDKGPSFHLEYIHR
jgi:hypothetical protein